MKARRILSFLPQMLALAALGADSRAQETSATETAVPASLDLVGNRFRLLESRDLDAAQRTLVQNVLAGPRGSLGGPFNIWLRSPEMGDLAQQFGAHVRFGSSLPATLREMAIIMTARHWTAHFEWYVHKNAALETGLDTAIVDAITENRRPDAMRLDEAALYDFCDELLKTHRVTDATFAAAVAALGERGIVDVIGTVGYYSMVSMLLNVDEYPLPEGVAAELEPLP